MGALAFSRAREASCPRGLFVSPVVITLNGGFRPRVRPVRTQSPCGLIRNSGINRRARFTD
jgi:hypothetical protein